MDGNSYFEEQKKINESNFEQQQKIMNNHFEQQTKILNDFAKNLEISRKQQQKDDIAYAKQMSILFDSPEEKRRKIKKITTIEYEDDYDEDEEY